MNERLKKIRESLNLTQEEFANKLGLGRSTIAGFESGRIIQDRTIKTICKTFKLMKIGLKQVKEICTYL
ncbi:hypothetical protein CYK66_14810 [Clostridium perfringens]|nr:hypothetical protein CYK66_14810 [Clostridium perfringens]